MNWLAAIAFGIVLFIFFSSLVSHSWLVVIVIGLLLFMFVGPLAYHSPHAVARVRAWWRRSTPARRRDIAVEVGQALAGYLLLVLFQVLVISKKPMTGGNLAGALISFAWFVVFVGILYVVFVCCHMLLALLWHVYWYRGVLPLIRRYALWRRGQQAQHGHVS